MEIIEQIGSYAGLAAIVGLALLSALYFSQARDVRRLREAEDGREAGAGPKRPTAAVVPRQGAGAEVKAREGSQPAAAPPGRAAPVAAQDRSEEEDEELAAAPAAAASGAGASAAVAAPSAGNAQSPAETQAGPPPVERGNAAGRPSPAPPRLPSPRPGAAAAALRTASEPPATSAGRPWYKAVPPRYVALIVAGVVVVTAGAVYAFAALVGEGGSSGTEAASDEPGAGETQAPLDPSTITVAVLNGTDVAGLAGQIADSVEAAGFQRGNVSNAPEQGGAAESAVLFAEGAQRAARQVGEELDISQIEPLDEQSRALAGTADVVVVVGADRAD